MRKFLLTLILTSAISAPAMAQSKAELAAQDAILAERLDRLESRFLTGDPAAVELMQRMDALEAEQRSLTGSIEQLRHERDKLKAEIVALHEDLKTIEALSDRMELHLDAVDLVAKEPRRPVASVQQPGTWNYPGETPSVNSGGSYDGAPLAGGPSPTIIAEGPNNGAAGSVSPHSGTQHVESFPNLENLPSDGLRKLNEGNFSGAQMDFRTYLAVAPNAPDFGEVSYWLGETFFVKGGYADAADAYIQSLKTDPGGVKAPDAHIRLAASLRELGNKQEACLTLDSFSAQFPNASAAARQKMRDERARTGC